MSVAEAPPPQRRALVCFDFEGRWGMPFAARYDLATGARRILKVLDQHGVHATFFVVGSLAIERQDIVGDICAAGHEIALHGSEHERIARPSPSGLARLGEGLDKSGAAIAAVTGARPNGFRAPHLLAPRFFDPAVYELLAARGYRWASNREVRHVVELFRPDRTLSERPWRLVESRPGLLRGRAAQGLRIALNANVYLRNLRPASHQPGIRWLRDGAPPFYRDQILEIPLYTPMDCDLLGLPDPAAPTPPPILEFARFALRFCVGQAGKLTMLTFHDWIISGNGRLELLDAILAYMTKAGIRPVSVREAWPQLIRLTARRP